MILKQTNGVLFLKCKCGTEYKHLLKVGQRLKFLTEFNQFENLPTNPCPSCGTVEVFNMNIEDEQLNYEDIKKMNMPNKEINQRHYLIEIIKGLKV